MFNDIFVLPDQYLGKSVNFYLQGANISGIPADPSGGINVRIFSPTGELTGPQLYSSQGMIGTSGVYWINIPLAENKYVADSTYYARSRCVVDSITGYMGHSFRVIDDPFVDINNKLDGISEDITVITNSDKSYVSDFTLLTGTETENSYTDTATLDGTSHGLYGAIGGISFYYEFNLPEGQVGYKLNLTYYLDEEAGRSIDLYAYDFENEEWLFVSLLDLGTHSVVLQLPASCTDEFGFLKLWFTGDSELADKVFSIDFVEISHTVAGNSITSVLQSLEAIDNKIGTPEVTLAEDISNVAADIFTINPDDYDAGNNFAARTLAIQNTGVQILIDTNELQTNFTNGGTLEIRIDGLESGISGIKTKTDYLPSVTPGQANGLFIAGTNAATTVNFTGNVSGSVGSVATLGNGSSLSGIPWNSAWDVEVQSECMDALNAYDPPTKTELDTAVDNLVKENTAYDLTTENGVIVTTFVVE